MPKKRIEEIRAKFLAEIQRWGETIIAQAQLEGRGEIRKLKGKAPEGDLDQGTWYRWWGYWTHHPKFGKQFQFRSYTLCAPLDHDGIARYLQRAPHLGKRRAHELVRAYGQDAIRTLREDPARVAGELGARGFTEQNAREAAQVLESMSATEDATVELVSLFSGRGFPGRLVKDLLQEHGNRAAEVVRDDPYCLLEHKGVGFLRADRLYLDLGHDPQAIHRQALCVNHACTADEREGHTWLSGSAVSSYLRSHISATASRPRDAVHYGLETELLAFRRDSEGRSWIAATARSDPERSLAENAARMWRYLRPDWPEVGRDLSVHQSEQLARACASRLGIFTGGPGTGKTYSATRLIEALVEREGSASVAVVAPTGKAAVRISESLVEQGLAIRAQTIHSFLGVDFAGHDPGGSFAFVHSAGCPVDSKYVIVDEASMLDTWLLARLLEACRVDGHVLLVGDVGQLPPVGHGAPLRDLLLAGIPSGSLTEIRRNAGAIVRTCAAIRDERPIEIPHDLTGAPEDNLYQYLTGGGEQTLDAICSLASTTRTPDIGDPVWDMQVLVALNDRSPCARHTVNARLQAILNGRNAPRGGREAKYWCDDKVVCTRNNKFRYLEDWQVEDEDEEDLAAGEPVAVKSDDGKEQDVYVANGDLGRVLAVRPRHLIVEWYSPRRVTMVPATTSEEPPVELGYALSAHKSQGSEWPVVIVALDDFGGARMVCDRSWVYTAISRAKKQCILVGPRGLAEKFCRTQKISRRQTFLAQDLARAVEVLAEETRNGVEREEQDASPVEEAPAEGDAAGAV